MKDFGLSDGECCERLWSYLRRFSRMTKEMRPSTRSDLLSDALIYYSSNSINKLGRLIICIICTYTINYYPVNTLPQRMKKALSTKEDAQANLDSLINDSPIKFTTSDIERWYQIECMAEVNSQGKLHLNIIFHLLHTCREP